MIDRINLILKAKNLTSRQFAEEIGIQPSGMSHILSGRNRPSLDFVMKVVNRYPEIDIRWLTLGVGEMYNASVPAQPKPDGRQPDLFSSLQDEKQTMAPEVNDEPEQASVQPMPLPTEVSSSDPMMTAPSDGGAESTDNGPEDDAWLDGSDTKSASDKVLSAPLVTEGAAIVSGIGAETVQQGRHAQSETPGDCVSQAASVIMSRKRIEKVVILYDDHTFAEYYPE
ncbi:MAG: helix-turn-helix transcriptional regulator [Bacteroidales bacterium]|nr:helix-turn-helix transcriptional regulator [Bacteroidales bacterium]